MSAAGGPGQGFHVRLAAQVAQMTGLNAPLALGIATRAFNALSYLVTLHLLTTNLSQSLQGYYFAFISLAQLSQLADLGMQPLVLQFASHEASRLDLARGGALLGEAGAVSRLVSLGRFGFAWFGGGALLYVPAFIAVGFWMFGGAADGVAWQGPWLAVCALVACDLMLNSIFWMLEGLNDLNFVYAYRLARAVAMAVMTWLLLAGGLDLWAVAFSFAGAVAISALFLLGWRRAFVVRLLRHTISGNGISWRREIMPLQGRLAVSVIAGFATYSLLTPITFKLAGPVAAGQFGLSWMLVEAMTSVAMLWPNTRFPTMGRLAADRDWPALDQLALRAGGQALALTLVGACIIVAATWLVNFQGLTLAERLLPPLAMTILAAASLPKIAQSAMIFYLRAHRREPIVVMTAILTPVTIAAVSLGAWKWGVLGVAVAYFCVTALLVLPATAWILVRCRRAWHGPQAA